VAVIPAGLAGVVALFAIVAMALVGLSVVIEDGD
jgi:hypothetical protein